MFYCRININFRNRKKKKLTLRLSKVLTVCAKSLTLPGDAVPCPLGPEDTREPSMTSKPESKASEQLQWDSFALWPAIRYVFKPMDKNYSQHRLKPPLVEMQLHLALCVGHAPEKLRVKWKCEYVIFYYWLPSFQRRTDSERMSASKTHYLLTLCFLWMMAPCFTLRGWMNIKIFLLERVTRFLRDSRAHWWWTLHISWVYFDLSIAVTDIYNGWSRCKGDLEY